MTREIKFRAWDTEKKKWLDSTDFMVCNCGRIAPRVSGTNEYRCMSNTPFIVMQFTGLKDNNGKEIYEGDILLDDAEGRDYNAVEWSPENAGFTTTDWYGPRQLAENAKLHEVIGNIYEDPELTYP